MKEMKRLIWKVMALITSPAMNISQSNDGSLSSAAESAESLATAAVTTRLSVSVVTIEFSLSTGSGFSFIPSFSVRFREIRYRSRKAEELKLEVLESSPDNERLERDRRRRVEEEPAVRRAEEEGEGEEAEVEHSDWGVREEGQS